MILCYSIGMSPDKYTNFPPLEPEEPIGDNSVQHFDPEQLGLDYNKVADKSLYIDASGDRILAEDLIAERDLKEQFRSGQIDEKSYADAFGMIDQRFHDRRDKLFPPDNT